jgi:hypothetical protein
MWTNRHLSVSSTFLTVCAFNLSCFLRNVSMSTSILFLSKRGARFRARRGSVRLMISQLSPQPIRAARTASGPVAMAITERDRIR